MTITQAIQALHTLYVGDTNYPTEGDDDWNHYLQLIILGVRKWEGEEGIFWPELWDFLSNASDGTKVVSANTLAYLTPTNFRFLGDYVRTYTTSSSQKQWKIVTSPRLDFAINSGLDYVAVTGNKSAGYKINFLNNPTTGDTIEYPYYKDATIPSAGTNVLEMGRPMFTVFYALAQRLLIDKNGDGATAALEQAQAELDAMRTTSQMAPNNQDNSIEDGDEGAGFGR